MSIELYKNSDKIIIKPFYCSKKYDIINNNNKVSEKQVFHLKNNGIEEIKVLSDSEIFSERESGVTHTPYETEVMFYNCIKNGDCEKAEKMMNLLLSQSVIVGRLSDDPLRQMKYWAVCSITLGTRYAIAGGLDETTAFNYSDEIICKIDRMTSAEEIFVLLKDTCINLTSLVAESKNKVSYSAAVRKCIHFINTNLHEKLSLELLSKKCNLSPDYLSALFKKEVGQTIISYIKDKRLEAAKDMLYSGQDTSSTAYYLGFCSESYFIKCFREKFGITPKKFALGKKL